MLCAVISSCRGCNRGGVDVKSYAFELALGRKEYELIRNFNVLKCCWKQPNLGFNESAAVRRRESSRYFIFSISTVG